MGMLVWFARNKLLPSKVVFSGEPFFPSCEGGSPGRKVPPLSRGLVLMLRFRNVRAGTATGVSLSTGSAFFTTPSPICGSLGFHFEP